MFTYTRTRLSCQGRTDIDIKDCNYTLVDFSRVQKRTLVDFSRVQISQGGQTSFVVDSVLILLRAPGLMSVGFGLAAIRASQREVIVMTDGKRDACTCSSLGSEAVVADFLGAADLRRRGPLAP